MEYSFAPLYVRIGFLLLIGVLLAVVLFWGSKKQKNLNRILMCTAAVLLGFIMSFSSICALVKPQVNTIICTFVGYSNAGDAMNPFSMEGEFSYDGTSVWIELDALTKSKVLNDIEELEIGKTYAVTYEVREKLVLGVEEQ